MLSKMASLVEASIDDEFSMDLFEAVMDQQSSYFLDPPKPKIAKKKKKLRKSKWIIGIPTGARGCRTKKC